MTISEAFGVSANETFVCRIIVSKEANLRDRHSTRLAQLVHCALVACYGNSEEQSINYCNLLENLISCRRPTLGITLGPHKYSH